MASINQLAASAASSTSFTKYCGLALCLAPFFFFSFSPFFSTSALFFGAMRVSHSLCP